MNPSDSDGSSAALMDGLRELGLAVGQDPHPKKSKRPPASKPSKPNPVTELSDPVSISSDSQPKPKPDPAATKPKKPQRGARPAQGPDRRRKSKARPPAPRLALLDFLDDIPAQPPEQRPEQPPAPPPEKPPELPIEARIGDYLSSRARQVTEAFRTEVTRMLQHTDKIDTVVREFLADLRGAVKKEVTFEGCTTVLTPVLSVADSEVAKFRDPIAAVETITSKTDSHHSSAISAARDLIKVRTAAVREIIGRTAETVEREITDFENIKLTQVKRQRESEHRQSLISAQMTEVEATEILHRADQQLLEHLRKSSCGFASEKGAIAIARYLRNFVAGMKDRNEREGAMFQLMRRKALEAAEEVEEMRAMRARCQRDQEQFCQTVKMISFVFPFSTQKQRLRQTVADSETSESVASTRTEASITELRSKLESIQMEQDKALENLSLFLDQVKREVPKGRRSRR
jgi:hypothetical protein